MKEQRFICFAAYVLGWSDRHHTKLSHIVTVAQYFTLIFQKERRPLSRLSAHSLIPVQGWNSMPPTKSIVRDKTILFKERRPYTVTTKLQLKQRQIQEYSWGWETPFFDQFVFPLLIYNLLFQKILGKFTTRVQSPLRSGAFATPTSTCNPSFQKILDPPHEGSVCVTTHGLMCRHVWYHRYHTWYKWCHIGFCHTQFNKALLYAQLHAFNTFPLLLNCLLTNELTCRTFQQTELVR